MGRSVVTSGGAGWVVTGIVYGGQMSWQLPAEYHDVMSTDAVTGEPGSAASGGRLGAEHVYGQYIDELFRAKRDLDRDGGFLQADGVAADSTETLYLVHDDL